MALYIGGFWVGQWSEPSATITNLSCGQNYTIGISALDAAGNTSPQTTAFFSTAPCADRMAPTSPTGLAVSKSTTTSVSLTWTASTDASGVAEYGLYKEGTKVDSATATSGGLRRTRVRAHVHVRCRRGRCGAEQVCRRDAVGGDCALSDHDHTAPAASPDDGLDGPDGAAEPPNDLGHADGGLARLGLEHRPGRHVRIPDLP